MIGRECVPAAEVVWSALVLLLVGHALVGCVLPDATVASEPHRSRHDAQVPVISSAETADGTSDQEERAAAGSGAAPSTPQADPVPAGSTPPSSAVLDPCDADNGGCDTEPLAICTNESGVAHCACPDGYAGNALGASGCTKVDKCASNNGGCDTTPLALCTNGTSSVVTCTCPSGYLGNGVGQFGCGDTNECLANNGGCDTAPMATCTNQAGKTPLCACPSGYSGTGLGTLGCLDINECSTSNGGCDTAPMATCTNTAGSRTCACPSGYSGSGIGASGCADINECLTNNGGCDTSPMATCTNTAGNRTCKCPAGTGNNGVDYAVCGRLFYTDSHVWDYQNSVTWQRVLPATYTGCSAKYFASSTSTAGEACTWSQANSYCANLTLEGRTEWRLPTSKELASVVDPSATGAKIFPASFPNTPAAQFWSSTPYDATDSWYVCFCAGESDWGANSDGRYVRCVIDW